jgi:hypothetical protein
MFAAGMNNFSMSPDLVIIIRINLHTKSSGCETGFGFCRLHIGTGISGQNPQFSNDLSAQAYLNGSNQLVLKISDSDLQRYEDGKSLPYFQGKKSITVSENYPLGSDLDKALGAASPLVIRAGIYNVTYEGGIYTMIFPQ